MTTNDIIKRTRDYVNNSQVEPSQKDIIHSLLDSVELTKNSGNQEEKISAIASTLQCLSVFVINSNIRIRYDIDTRIDNHSKLCETNFKSIKKPPIRTPMDLMYSIIDKSPWAGVILGSVYMLRPIIEELVQRL